MSPPTSFSRFRVARRAGERRDRALDADHQSRGRQVGISRLVARIFSAGTTMKFPRRKVLHLAAGAAALPAVARVANAQAYPTRPVRIVVGFAVGGST